MNFAVICTSLSLPPPGTPKDQRALARERQREGIEVAKKRGGYKGRAPALTPEQTVELRARAAVGEAKTVLARRLGISRATVYAYHNGR